VDKLIITAALTGAELTRAQQPALPISPDEIAQAAWECAQAGAAIVHVHARRADGSSTQEAAAYRSIIEAVRARCDVVVQVSTGGAVGMTAQERVAPLALRPEMATLSMGSVNFGDGVFLNPPPDIEHFLHTMRAHGVVPEFEVFDAGMLGHAGALGEEGRGRCAGACRLRPGCARWHVRHPRSTDVPALAASGWVLLDRGRHRRRPIADGHAGHRARRSRARGLRGQHLAAPR
jgi:uncharacterized protein (DUF849 family)